MPMHELLILHWTGEAERQEAHSWLAALRDNVILIASAANYGFLEFQNGGGSTVEDCSATSLLN